MELRSGAKTPTLFIPIDDLFVPKNVINIKRIPYFSIDWVKTRKANLQAVFFIENQSVTWDFSEVSSYNLD